MKFKWPIFLGASIAATALGISLRKKEPSADTAKRYVGAWHFFYPKNQTQHTLTIYPDLSIVIDGKEMTYQLVELSEHKLIVQDELGYHVVIQMKNGAPHTLYDEADDISFPIIPAK